jgi:hypothetical protein
MLWSQYERLNLHVSASNIDVIRAVRPRLAPEALQQCFRPARHSIYRKAIQHHADARNLFSKVMGGRI